MLGLGIQELLIIFFIIILLFGAKKLPDLAAGLGKGIKEFKKATQGRDEDDQKKIEEGKIDGKE
ncbi:MAG: twin-arginine translocase TatA/TatE family subunit [bacterium]|jgi:sec-independent protein translocase protein TatA|nr:twin-arginine translocase TatA/TatE family subunit [bacterium]